MNVAPSVSPTTAHLALPFFGDEHRALARELLPWIAAQQMDEHDDRAACREWVRRLGDGGWLRYCVPAASGGALAQLDMALQMHGGLGVKVGTRVEALYRDIRSLRIYEGATEVQQLIIGKAVLRGTA